ncbi:unnamed protein product, partial [Scytosiphon promiscuus]
GASAAAAIGARAQELAEARFARMRSAAEAKSAAAAAAAAASAATGDAEEAATSVGSKSGSSVASSFGKGSEEEDLSGDMRLRQDVSQLVAVMAKKGMLTDRQRLFLLAQVGRRITKMARERHALYKESGDSKELYMVLMALSTPAQKTKTGGSRQKGLDGTKEHGRVRDEDANESE